MMGVTVAEGTEEVGVLDLLPVLLGVAATESDSEPSSFTGWDAGAGDERSTLELCSRQLRECQNLLEATMATVMTIL